MEGSYNVAVKNNWIVYIVGSNIASLLPAQMSVNHDPNDVFEELLCKKAVNCIQNPSGHSIRTTYRSIPASA